MAANIPKLRVTDPQSNTTSPEPSPVFRGPEQFDGTSDVPTRTRSPATKENGNPTLPPSRTSTSSKPGGLPNSHDVQDTDVPAIDPLSQHILKRTQTGTPIAEKLKSPTQGSSPRPATPREDTQEFKRSSETPRADVNKEKKKGVSFLSRFIGGNKRKSTIDLSTENGSDAGDVTRLEGNEAEIFSQPIANLGFQPKHPQPPAYIKVRARFKKEKEFDRVFLAQELRTKPVNKKKSVGPNGSSQPNSGESAGGNPVWALEFSRDGKYLAAGGQDKIVRVWGIISNSEERRTHEKEETAAGQSQHLSAPVFQNSPLREYEGHTSTILDLSWSKNNFLLSSSMDKTVRLWHISRGECLCTFKHTDFVPSIQFHPRDDRFFLAGSLDTKLRLWSIPDKNVAYWNQLPDMITAVSFSPDGKTAIAGTLNGLCQFYETEGLKYQTQMHVKSTHGKNAKGSKITGIQTASVAPDSPTGEIKILVSSNDSRIRLYNFRDKALEMKFRGHENNQSQIKATFSDDAKYIICGSEDRKAYLFSTGPSESDKKNQAPVEMFEAHSSITTCAVMAPVTSRQLLSRSEDPVYDICNPPPVTLVSKAESIRSSKPPTESGSNQMTPVESTFKRVEGSPAYIARSQHNDGNIIVTADYWGCIKVFRQDCAFSKRRSDLWETSSTFSKKMGRTMSINTRGSGRSRRDSISTQPPDDRIMSWRQDVQPGGSVDSLALRNGGARSKTRSRSPQKSFRASSSVVSSQRRRGDSISTTDHTNELNGDRQDKPEHYTEPKDFDTERNPMWVLEKQSYAFWNTDAVKAQMERAHLNDRDQSPEKLERPTLSQQASTVSALSSEENFKDRNGEDEPPCRACGKRQFERKHFGTQTRLVCASPGCGVLA